MPVGYDLLAAVNSALALVREGRFAEGFDTEDLKEAKALLEELGTR